MRHPLDDYLAKRTPASTPEPVQGDAPSVGPLLFVIQKHNATNLHYDLRLEVGGVLKSWAVPRGPSDDPVDKRFAAETEDHPYSYASFEGGIPRGQYGAGEMLVWDIGTWYPDEIVTPGGERGWNWSDPEWRSAVEASIHDHLAAGKLSVLFRGQRLHGSWALVKTKEGWLFFKHSDPWKGREPQLLTRDTSVLTGRTLEQIARGESGTAPIPLIPSGPLEAWPKKLSPMKADIGQRAFDHRDWIFEPKLDGIRALVSIRAGQATIMTRYGNDQTSQFPELARHLSLQKGEMILDGEIVAFEDGQPGFTAMMKRFHLKGAEALDQADRVHPCVFFAFDVLHLDGVNLRGYSNRDRKRFLRSLLMPTERIQYVDHLDEHGTTFYHAVVQAGFEGSMAKKADSRYDASGKRSSAWLKLKYTTSADLVIGGFSRGEGSRSTTFGAIYVGYWEEERLIYVGRVGSGFDDSSLSALLAKMEPLATSKCPFANEVDVEGPTIWIEPVLAAEIKFTEMMPSGRIRTPVFLRERPDLEARDIGPFSVVRDEVSAPAAQATAAPQATPLVASVLAQLDSKEKTILLAIGSHKLSVTNLNKELWPANGDMPPLTKRDFLTYLTRISPYMLPHTADRPMTLIRMPEGIHGERFFQKHLTQGRPDFVDVITLWGDTNSKNHEYINANSLATLLWMGQLGSLELHVPAARVSPGPDGDDLSLNYRDSDENIRSSILNYPDFIRFDLDPYIYSGLEKPGEEPELNREAFEKGKTVAFWIKGLLDAMNLPSFVKTTGKTGLHLFVPIVRNLDTQACKAVCATICGSIERDHPREVTTEWNVTKRTGKIFLDYNMNALGKTLGAAYSPRALPNQSLSMPLTWDELKTAYPDDFTMRNVWQWLDRRGDPWADILGQKVDVAAALGMT